MPVGGTLYLPARVRFDVVTDGLPVRGRRRISGPREMDH